MQSLSSDPKHCSFVTTSIITNNSPQELLKEGGPRDRKHPCPHPHPYTQGDYLPRHRPTPWEVYLEKRRWNLDFAEGSVSTAALVPRIDKASEDRLDFT